MRLLRFCTVPPLSIWPVPSTITPLSLSANGRKPVPRSVTVPLLSRNPSMAPVLVVPQPAIWPRLLIAVTMVTCRPPSVPRTVTVPFCHSTACSVPLASRQLPMIWLLLLIASAAHEVNPLGSGRLVMVPLLYTQGCEPVPLVLCEE